jgi:hypothetical protein
MTTTKKVFTLHKNNWYGLGARVFHSEGDGWIIVLHFICWQIWIEFGGIK